MNMDDETIAKRNPSGSGAVNSLLGNEYLPVKASGSRRQPILAERLRNTQIVPRRLTKPFAKGKASRPGAGGCSTTFASLCGRRQLARFETGLAATSPCAKLWEHITPEHQRFKIMNELAHLLTNDGVLRSDHVSSALDIYLHRYK